MQTTSKSASPNLDPPQPSIESNATVDRATRAYILLCAIVSLIGVLLVVYSQVRAFAWDEGFHLLAAHSINAGKRPYIDFCFSQTPLIAYWNALWMRLFGE